MRQEKKSKQSLTIIGVYCKCRAPFFESDTDKDPEFYMIECSVYIKYFHKKCEKVHYIYFRDHKIVLNCYFCKQVYFYIDCFNDYI